MAIPNSLKEEKEWCKMYQPPENDALVYFYLPISDEVQPNVWLLDGSGNVTHTYENWPKTEPNGGDVENCALLYIYRMDPIKPEEVRLEII